MKKQAFFYSLMISMIILSSTNLYAKQFAIGPLDAQKIFIKKCQITNMPIQSKNPQTDVGLNIMRNPLNCLKNNATIIIFTCLLFGWIWSRPAKNNPTERLYATLNYVNAAVARKTNDLKKNYAYSYITDCSSTVNIDCSSIVNNKNLIKGFLRKNCNQKAPPFKISNLISNYYTEINLNKEEALLAEKITSEWSLACGDFIDKEESLNYELAALLGFTPYGIQNYLIKKMENTGYKPDELQCISNYHESNFKKETEKKIILTLNYLCRYHKDIVLK
jgi:ubiquitin